MAAVEAPAAPLHASVKAGFRKDGGCLETLLDLARAVRKPRQSVGYSAFIVFASLRKRRIWVWEGSNRVDIASVFLPSWASEGMSASVEADAACCTAVPSNNGPPTFALVSAAYPLSTATHYVAVVHTGVFDDSDTTSLDGYCASLGQAVISIVADGDCGIVAMLKIVCERSTPLVRKQLREELANFMIARIQQRWFQEVMAACQEVTWEAVKQFHELEQCVSEGQLVAPSVVAPAVAVAAEDIRALAPQAVCEELLKAVAWHADLQDEGVQLVVAEALAPAEREALLLQYKNRDTSDKRVTRRSCKVMVHPHFLQSRMEVAVAFDEHLREEGWQAGQRIPRHVCNGFLEAWECSGR